MGFSEELMERIRAEVALDPRVTEKRMFGGLCFLLDGKILVAARRTGGLLVQCGAEAGIALTQEEGVSYMQMRGKPALGFIEVEADRLEANDDLRRWIAVAERYVSMKPAAATRAAKRRSQGSSAANKKGSPKRAL